MEQLLQLFQQWAGVPCAQCLALGASGSSRRYFRLLSSPLSEENHNTLSSPLCEGGRGVPPKLSAIGCINDDIRENQAFFAYSRHLHAKGIHVPELYAVSPDSRHYLQQDLGDQTLYSLLLDKKRLGLGFDAQMLNLYKQALSDLAAIQSAGADIDFSQAYPRPDFDRQAILWDLNYFKYHFLKLVDIPFHEQLLENDFNTLADTLLQADTSFFLYRDFNPRNIMIVGSGECVEGGTRGQMLPTLYYIDYQGGRRGAAQYDVASLLYSAKSDLPEAIRRDLLNHYLDSRRIHGEQRTLWLHHFHAYLLLRILQTLGAYGYRGIFQRKPYFLQSIPLALNNLRLLTENHPDLLATLPELAKVISAASQLSSNQAIKQSTNQAINQSSNQSIDQSNSLTVTVLSFSYKQGLPTDPSGNGGGFIFDCRALPNPGRYPQYKSYTGKDRPVIEFLQKEPAVDRFLDNAKALVAQSVEKYLERHFTSLQVAFGCTGGQHRSVYCAEQLAAWLSATYPCQVQLIHREQDHR